MFSLAYKDIYIGTVLLSHSNVHLYVPMIMKAIAIYDLHTAFASVLLVALIAFALYVSAKHTTLALIASRCLSTRDAEDASSDIGAYSSALLQNDYPPTSLRAKWFQKAFDVSAYTLLFLVPFYVALHMNYLTLILPDIDISSKSLSGGLNGGAIALLTAEAAVAIVIFVYHARLAYKSGSVAKYIGGYISTFALIAMADALLGPQFEFHLHHSFIAALLWPATLFKTWFSSLKPPFSASF